jgi:hypothetical protein
MILNFKNFKDRVLFESKSTQSGTSCIIAASNSSEMKAQERFITEVAMMDPTKLNDLLNSVISGGKNLAGKLGATMQKRKSEGLDSGPLTKKGEWYVGKGAWRINSAKADRLGMTPEFIQYFDPLQSELLEEHFPEMFGKSDITISKDGDLEDLEKSLFSQEKELELAESLKYIKRIDEAEDFTLGPPAGAKNAVVVDTNELEEQLVDNFFLETRENVMIWGAPGIGKTEVVKSVATKIEARLGKPVPVIVVTLATKAAYDIAGIPILFAKEATSATTFGEEMRGKVGMDFAYPAWLPPSDDTGDGILFFDEINRADKDVMGAALTLLLDRISGNYKMPDGWRIWAAGNRDMDGPVKPMEGAMASRFLGGHFHLVPTVDGWSEWARSEKAYFKGIGGAGSANEWYVLDELITFFKLKDVAGATKEGASGTISNLGRVYRVKFEYFYNWDEAAAAENAGGKMEGFPTPRTWAKACSVIYQKLKSNQELMDQVPSTIDARKRVISQFGNALLDPKMQRDILLKMSAVVGTDAADAFIQFAGQMARLNDANGTLVEKVENIFTNPKGPRALLDIPRLSSDEVFGVLNAVEGQIDSLVSSNKFKTAELSNWMQYVLDLEDDKKATEGEIAQHVTVVLTKHAQVIRPLSTPKNPELTPNDVKTIQEFSKRWRDYGEALRSL